MSGCSTKAPDNSGGGGDANASGGDVKTGRGIDGDTLTLGVLTDLSGVFAALGKDVTNAQKLFWDDVNAGGGVCDKYKVELNVKDHGYNVQQAVQLYGGMKDSVLALQHTIGSPINTALADQMTADNMVNIPEAWARNLTVPPGNAVVGTTYDVEMINGLDYLLQQGLIKEGDKLGHIYFEGEYGANGLAGSKYFASQHNMTVDEAQIKATDADMSSVVTKFKADGVNAILLTVAPGQTASAAAVANQVGLTVPILGNNPVFAPGLLDSPAGQVLKDHLFIASPVTTFDKQPELLKKYTDQFPGGTPSLGVVHGYADAVVMDQILEKACESGDLTPEGVLKAKQSLSDVDTDGLAVPLDFSVQPGESPSQQSFILQPTDGPGGAKAITEAQEGDDVKNFKPGS
ncbi:ABC transporter substrate-binding protein [Modestobacter sp. DSM 44400]|uniref:ABC transporter substrate-binding protein n=1 Tax=Modestobacter sp. DSM 44400 TaxID=1550230 RepID=UPI0020C883FA|nr:ABC transporter substrate-binding protein [Modestobacter sp. DSM 44400]